MLNDLIKHQVNKLQQQNSDSDLEKNDTNNDTNEGKKSSFDKLDKKSKYDLVTKMKEEVPTVLLHKWLDISPEKSRFANRPQVDPEEYSVYSESTLSKHKSFLSSPENKKNEAFKNQDNNLKIPEVVKLGKGGSESPETNKITDYVMPANLTKSRSIPRNSQFMSYKKEIISLNGESNDVTDVVRNQLLADSDYSVSDDEGDNDQEPAFALTLRRNGPKGGCKNLKQYKNQLNLSSDRHNPNLEPKKSKIASKYKKVFLKKEIKKMQDPSLNVNFKNHLEAKNHNSNVSDENNFLLLLNPIISVRLTCVNLFLKIMILDKPNYLKIIL